MYVTAAIIFCEIGKRRGIIFLENYQKLPKFGQNLIDSIISTLPAVFFIEDLRLPVSLFNQHA